MSSTTGKSFDVVAINSNTGMVIWVDGPHDDREEAEAVVKMAIMRQGVDDRHFVIETAGTNAAGKKAVRSKTPQSLAGPRGPRGTASQRGVS